MNIQNTKPTKICEHCEKEFIPHRKVDKHCSTACYEASALRCEICGQYAHNLGIHIVKKHPEISKEEYKTKYNLQSLVSPSLFKKFSDRVKGDKNPAYQHGGKLSPFSKNFKKYNGLSEEETQLRIDEVCETSSNTAKMNPQKRSTNIEYYLAQGMTEEEGLIALANRQVTFSLDTCQEKYGEELGKEIWLKRQEKWQNTLLSKSPEEIEEINKKKSFLSFKSEWAADVDQEASFYVLALSETSIKIGITTKELNKRYTLFDLSKVKVLMVSKSSINHVFQIEQLLKRKYINNISKGDYGPFGWTEVIHDVDSKLLLAEATSMLSDTTKTKSEFHATFKK